MIRTPKILSKCPGATFDVGLDASGTVTFSGDGSYQINFTAIGQLSVTLPAACIAQLTQGQAQSCAEIAALLDDEGSVTCTGTVDSQCECSGQVGESDVNNESGTYTTSGTTLTITESGGTPNALSYCVNGDELRVYDDTSEDGSTITVIGKK